MIERRISSPFLRARVQRRRFHGTGTAVKRNERAWRGLKVSA